MLRILETQNHNLPMTEYVCRECENLFLTEMDNAEMNCPRKWCKGTAEPNGNAIVTPRGELDDEGRVEYSKLNSAVANLVKKLGERETIKKLWKIK